MENPLRLILSGLLLLILGVVVPFLIVLGMLESTYFLNFLSFACSTTGLVTGFIGLTQYVRARR